MAEQLLNDLPECPVETTLTLIGSKWKVLILRDLLTGYGGLRLADAPGVCGGAAQSGIYAD